MMNHVPNDSSRDGCTEEFRWDEFELDFARYVGAAPVPQTIEVHPPAGSRPGHEEEGS